MSDAAPIRRKFPAWTLTELKQHLAAAADPQADSLQAMREEIARREAGTSRCFVVPQVSSLQRKAAAPLMARKPQEFDTSALPLFGDQAKQGNLFD